MDCEAVTFFMKRCCFDGSTGQDRQLEIKIEFSGRHHSSAVALDEQVHPRILRVFDASFKPAKAPTTTQVTA